MYNLIQIDNIAIAIDEYGRYRLNDLHKASGGESRHKPSDWLRLNQTKEIIEDIKSDVQEISTSEISEVKSLPIFEPIEVINGGTSPGTYVIKELVYAYATWISPKFFRHVLKVFEDKQQAEITRRERMTEIEVLRENAKIALENSKLSTRLADEMESKQKLITKIDEGALFEKLNQIQDNRPVISIEDIRENYFLGFSSIAITQFLRYINHPKREVVVAGKFPKLMYIDENLFEAAHKLWTECEKVNNKKYVELFHKCFIDRKTIMDKDIAVEVWNYNK